MLVDIPSYVLPLFKLFLQSIIDNTYGIDAGTGETTVSVKPLKKFMKRQKTKSEDISLCYKWTQLYSIYAAKQYI